jgi:hypothetical protein
LLAEYLRVWGLRDPSIVASLSQKWVRQAEQTLEPANENDSLDVLYRAAVAAATREIDQWLDHLASSTSGDAGDAAGRRGPMALEVQSLLDKYPEAFLRYEKFPAWLTKQLARSARPVVPPSQPTRMEGPPLGEVRLPRWMQVWRRWFGGSRNGSSFARPRSAK